MKMNPQRTQMRARKLRSKNEKGDKTADTKESQRILRTHFKRKSILHQMKSKQKNNFLHRKPYQY